MSKAVVLTEVLEEIAKRPPKQPKQLEEVEKALLQMHARWQRKQPIFRETARFREHALPRRVQAMQGKNACPSWFSQMAEYLDEYTMDLHSAVMCWVGWRLKEVSDIANWFRPTEALTYKLLATDLRGALCGDLKLPVEAFYIEMPPNLFFMKDEKTGWHEMRTICVASGEVSEETIRYARAHGLADTETPHRGHRLLIECYGEPNENSESPMDDKWMFSAYDIFEDTVPVEEVLNRAGADASYAAQISGRIGEKEMEGDEVLNMLFTFVLNLCIYMGSEKSKVEHEHATEIKKLEKGKKRKHLRKNVQERISRLEADNTFVVGSDVRVDLELREHVRSSGVGGSSLVYRTLVRGHWRNQAHGPQRALRKRKWIEPHIRGAELPTKVVGHNYEVV